MKTTKILFLILTSISMFGCQQKHEYKLEEQNDVLADHEYSEISSYEITWDKMFEVSKEKYYVYFYSLTCNHCSDLKNYIIEKALETKDIYFVKSSSKDKLANDTQPSIGAENPEDIVILGYPSLLKIVDKKCVKNLAGFNQIIYELK